MLCCACDVPAERLKRSKRSFSTTLFFLSLILFGCFPSGLAFRDQWVSTHTQGSQCWDCRVLPATPWEAFLWWGFSPGFSQTFRLEHVCFVWKYFVLFLRQCCLEDSEVIEVRQEYGTDVFGKSTACRVGLEVDRNSLWWLLGWLFTSSWNYLHYHLETGWGDRGQCRVTPLTWSYQFFIAGWCVATSEASPGERGDPFLSWIGDPTNKLCQHQHFIYLRYLRDLKLCFCLDLLCHFVC